MSREISVNVSYEVVKLLVKMNEYHVDILQAEMETKSREKNEILNEMEICERLRVRLLLYLAKITENVKLYLNNEEIILIERLCYFFSSINKEIIRVDERGVKELEEFHHTVNTLVSMIRGSESVYLN